MAGPAIGAASHYTPPNVVAINAMLPDDTPERRFDALSRRESFYRCEEYEDCCHDFAGRSLSPASGDGIIASSSTRDYLGAVNEEIPHDRRRPSAPSRLAKTIVHRFSALLFSTSSRPAVRVLGDPDTQDWVAGVLDASGFWPALREGRDYGGSQGTAVLSWSIRGGRPILERHNPKTVTPAWLDRARCLLASIEIAYPFHRLERDRHGALVRVAYQYRRVIDAVNDTLYPARGLTNPEVSIGMLQVHPHRFGVCPVVWIQNTPSSEDIDGEPDCYGQYDAIRAYDQQLAHALHGTARNCDPTVVIATDIPDAKNATIYKGSSNAIVLKRGDSSTYMEMSGGGVVQARENAALLREAILEAVCVVIEGDATVEETATKVTGRRQAMFDRVDSFREQYGAGVVLLVEMLIRYARTVQTVTLVEEATPAVEAGNPNELTDLDGEAQPTPAPRLTLSPEGAPTLRAVREVIYVPPKVEDDPTNPESPARLVPRKLGTVEGAPVSLQWPDHDGTTATDVTAWTGALTAAQTAGYVDGETAARRWLMLAGIDNPNEVIKKAHKEREEREAKRAEAEDAVNKLLVGSLGGGKGEDGKPPKAPPVPDAEPDDADTP